MTTWTLQPISPRSARILVRVHVDGHLAGELDLRREAYGDLARRLGVDPAFDPQTGQPLTLTVTSPPPGTGAGIAAKDPAMWQEGRR